MNFLRNITTILFLFVFYNQSIAQEIYTISGRIKDKISGEDIIGAKITIKELKAGAVTNRFGFFSVKAPEGNYTIIVQYSGYSNQNISLSITKDILKDIYIVPISYQASELVVSATKDNQNVSSTKMGKTELTMAAVQKLPSFLGESDVIRALLLTPGVTSATDIASGFNVRGGSVDQNLVLLDDAILYNPTHFGGLFSAFNGDALKSATLYKTSIPVEYGGRLSSVLDIRQRDGNFNNYSGSVGIGFIASRALFEGPLGSDKGSFLVSFRRSYVDLILNALPPVKSLTQGKGVDLYFMDINAKFNYSLSDNDRIYGSFYYGMDKVRFPITTTATNASTTVTPAFTYGNIAGTFRWNHVYSKDLFSNLIVSYSEYNFNTNTEIVQSNVNTNLNTTDVSAFTIDINQRIMNFSIKNDYSYVLTNTLLLRGGVEGIVYAFSPGTSTFSSSSYSINNVNNQSTDPVKANIPVNLDNRYSSEWAVYFGADHDILENVKLEYGLRFTTYFGVGAQNIQQYLNNNPVTYDKVTGIAAPSPVSSIRSYGTGELIMFYYNFEPRANIRYLIDEETSLKASYNWLSQNIHLVSLSSVAVPFDTWYPSSPYIKPQTSHNFSLGVYRNFFNNELEISVEGYYRIFENVLDYVEGGQVLLNNNIETAVRQGEGRAYGVELSIIKNKGKNGTLWDNLTGSISYTYSKSERKVSDEAAAGLNLTNLWYPAPYDKTHVFNTTLSYEIDHWTFSAVFSYQTNIPVNVSLSSFTSNNLRNGLGQFGFYGYDRNAYRLSDYHRLDLSLRYDFLTPIAASVFSTTNDIPLQMSLIFSVYNVYNRFNSIGTITINGQVREFGIIPILPNISFELKF